MTAHWLDALLCRCGLHRWGPWMTRLCPRSLRVMVRRMCERPYCQASEEREPERSSNDWPS